MTFASAIFDKSGKYVIGEQKQAQMDLSDASLQKLLTTGLDIKTAFQLKPGTYTVREVVMDSEEHRLGVVSRRRGNSVVDLVFIANIAPISRIDLRDSGAMGATSRVGLSAWQKKASRIGTRGLMIVWQCRELVMVRMLLMLSVLGGYAAFAQQQPDALPSPTQLGAGQIAHQVPAGRQLLSE